MRLTHKLRSGHREEAFEGGADQCHRVLHTRVEYCPLRIVKNLLQRKRWKGSNSGAQYVGYLTRQPEHADRWRCRVCERHLVVLGWQVEVGRHTLLVRDLRNASLRRMAVGANVLGFAHRLKGFQCMDRSVCGCHLAEHPAHGSNVVLEHVTHRASVATHKLRQLAELADTLTGRLLRLGKVHRQILHAVERHVADDVFPICAHVRSQTANTHHLIDELDTGIIHDLADLLQFWRSPIAGHLSVDLRISHVGAKSLALFLVRITEAMQTDAFEHNADMTLHFCEGHVVFVGQRLHDTEHFCRGLDFRVVVDLVGAGGHVLAEATTKQERLEELARIGSLPHQSNWIQYAL